MKNKKFGSHVEIILKKMCEYVNVNYDDLDFHNDEDPYYWKHMWTKRQEEDFRKWMADYLYNNTEARKEVMKFPIKRKKSCEGVANFFVFNHGWKLKD